METKRQFKEVKYATKCLPRIKSSHACHFHGKINTVFRHPQGQALEKISVCSQLDHVWTRGRTHLVINSNDCSCVKSHNLDIRNVAADNYLELGDHILQIFISIFHTLIWFERGYTKVKEIEFTFSTNTILFASQKNNSKTERQNIIRELQTNLMGLYEIKVK